MLRYALCFVLLGCAADRFVAASTGDGGADAGSLDGAVGADGNGVVAPYDPCPGRKYAFVTGRTFQGDLMGAGGASAHCNDVAKSAGLPGTYTAWISDTGSFASNTFMQGIPLYLPTSACTKAIDDVSKLTDSQLLHAIDTNELGKLVTDQPCPVWTGTNGMGGPTVGSLCIDWSSTSAKVFGQVGDCHAVNQQWSSAQGYTCDQRARLYCFQTGP
jgi:hypothetical protein